MATDAIGRAPKGLAPRRIIDAVGWRARRLRAAASRLLGDTEQHWARVVMDRATADYMASLDAGSLSVLEISGTRWAGRGFASYRSAQFPEFDLCGEPLGESFDLIVAEQVLEHVLWPYRAARNLWRMLKPGGVAVLTTPFLLRLHDYPVDCSRWTEVGLKHLLAEGGFDPSCVATGAWGNRACVKANFRRWRHWNPYLHSLENEPDFPVVVWAFATRSGGG